jgi:non-specific serine/threonine protein kinase
MVSLLNDMIGQTVSRYRILERLGAGGMGVVYRAKDLRLGRDVALKFLRHEVSQDPRLYERFQADARAASALNHPHTRTVHDIDQHEGHHFIVMELLEGSTLAVHLREGPLPTDRILEIGVQLVDALAAAHAKGIIHRDVKPANAFLTARAQVKLLDFGIAKLQTEPSGFTTSVVGLATALSGHVGDGLTRPGEAVGTLAYMSPEQIRRGELDPRTDLFSLGTVLYELATGSPAFFGTRSRSRARYRQR